MKEEKNYKVGRALFFAPIVIPIFLLGLAFILGEGVDDFGLMIVLTITLIGYLATLLIGLPSFYFLRHCSCLNLITLSICGFVLGSIIGIVASINGNILFDLLLGAVLGFPIALMFGLLAGVKVFSNGVDPGRKY